MRHLSSIDENIAKGGEFCATPHALGGDKIILKGIFSFGLSKILGMFLNRTMTARTKDRKA